MMLCNKQNKSNFLQKQKKYIIDTFYHLFRIEKKTVKHSISKQTIEFLPIFQSEVKTNKKHKQIKITFCFKDALPIPQAVLSIASCV